MKFFTTKSINEKGMTVVEILISLALSLFVFASFISFAIQIYKIKERIKIMEALDGTNDSIRLALSSRAYCNSAFKYQGSSGVFKPSSTPANTISQVDEIKLGNKSILKAGADLAPGVPVTISEIKLEPVLPMVAIDNNDGTKAYTTFLRIKYTVSGNNLEVPEKTFLTSVVANNSSGKIESCFQTGSKLERASASRLAINFAGNLNEVGCSVTNWNTPANKARYLKNSCADVNGNGLCDAEQTLYPTQNQKWKAVNAHPYYACSINPGPNKPHSVMDPNSASFDWCQLGTFPYRYTTASRFKMVWDVNFPTKQAHEAEIVPLYRKLSPLGPSQITVVNSTLSDQGRCPVTVTKIPVGKAHSDVFFVPSSSSPWKNHLALGCRKENGWFITGCVRANDGAGKTTAEIVLDSASGNQLCVTNDHIYPHIDGRPWQNLSSYLSVLCVRMDQ